LLGPVPCGPPYGGRPFSRSYGAIMPSSLAVLRPPALGYSPHPPVSVCGTGARQSIAAFLGTGPACFATPFRSASRHRPVRTCFPCAPPALAPGAPPPAHAPPHASPQFCCRAVQESPPAALRLRVPASPYAPTYPGQIIFPLETLDIRPRGFPPLSRYSFRHSPSPGLHPALRRGFLAPAMLPYRCTSCTPKLRRRVSAPDIFGAGLLD